RALEAVRTERGRTRRAAPKTTREHATAGRRRRTPPMRQSTRWRNDSRRASSRGRRLDRFGYVGARGRHGRIVEYFTDRCDACRLFLPDRVPAEFIAHRREQPVGERIVVARA